MLYKLDDEPDVKALDDIYVPMEWKKVEDPDSSEKDKGIESPMELFKQVILLINPDNT